MAISKEIKSAEIAIPAYNEERNIKKVVEKSLSWLKKTTKNYRVLVVDDGSTDNTGKILDFLIKKNKNLEIIRHKKNLGVGAAWNDLYKNASKDIIFTCPADQQFNPKDFSKILPYIEKTDIISIYRPKKEDYSFLRLIITNINRFLNKILFNLDIKDINWVKMYKKNILKNINLELKSPLIETEIMAKAKKRNAKIIQIEAPYHLRVYGKSKGISFKHLFSSLLELVKLYSITRKFK